VINLTPHAITLHAPQGKLTLPPSGTVARVITIETAVGKMLGVSVIVRQMSEAQGLPEPGIPCIVSAMVASAVPGRPGVFAPDTGPTAIRDERGQVVAVTRLVKA
jgi:hypothetical protein